MKNREDINIKELFISEQVPIKKAMQVIDRTGLNVAFVINAAGKLSGTISDSDIRRAILKGQDVAVSVKGIMNKNPVVLKKNNINNQYIVKRTIKKLHSRMLGALYIPVVDTLNRLVKLARCSDLLHIKEFKAERHRSIKKILVVGGAGYLGSVLTEKLLRKGYEVRVLDILLYGKKSTERFLNNKNYELIIGDMRNISVLAQVLQRVDAVVSLAAIVGDPACKSNPADTIETNYLANKILAEACKYHQINRFIFASTCSVYGVGKEVLDEEAALHPVSLYARSKIQTEEGILNLEDENFSPTILRMATLYGHSPRKRFDLVVNAMTKDAVCKKKITVYGGGMQWRPFLHTDDAAESYIKCLEAPLQDIKGEVFNVGSEKQNYRINQVAHAVSKCVPGSKIIKIGKGKDARNYSVSFRKIEKKLKYKAKCSLVYGIKQIKKVIESDKIKDVDDPSYYN